TRQTRDTRAAARFSNIWRKLADKKTLSRRWAILQCLNSLSDADRLAESSYTSDDAISFSALRLQPEVIVQLRPRSTTPQESQARPSSESEIGKKMPYDTYYKLTCHSALKGGALISAIQTYEDYGDTAIQESTASLLSCVTAPFYDILRKWLYEGDLEDPFEEFFVLEERNPDTDNLWRTQYTTQHDMIPSFMTRASAKKASIDGFPDVILSLTFGTRAVFDERIQALYDEVSRVLLDKLFDQYHLMDHFCALKKYLLLGQGEMIQNLMDRLGGDLDRPAQFLLRHNLIATLETSVRSSNAQFESPNVLKRLDVRLLEISPGDTGWDVFTLDYHLDPPLNTVFPPQAMHQYRRLFTFLWRVKRVEHALSRAWKRQATNITRPRRRVSGSQKSGLHLASITLSHMIHFIFELQYFFLFEGLESSWVELSLHLEKRIGDLDQLISAHHKFLNRITTKGLFARGANEETPVDERLRDLCSNILEFLRVLDEFFSSVAGADTEARETKAQRDFGRWAMHNAERNNYQSEDATVAERLLEQSLDFKARLEDFIHTVRSHTDTGLRGLADRIDYNFVSVGRIGVCTINKSPMSVRLNIRSLILR
ncbi:Gamma-tubulin complex component 3, partial [Cladochytrium tenue]